MWNEHSCQHDLLIYVKIEELLFIIGVRIHASFVHSSCKFWNGSEAEFQEF
jgi:hypothetical protein